MPHRSCGILEGEARDCEAWARAQEKRSRQGTGMGLLDALRGRSSGRDAEPEKGRETLDAELPKTNVTETR